MYSEYICCPPLLDLEIVSSKQWSYFKKIINEASVYMPHRSTTCIEPTSHVKAPRCVVRIIWLELLFEY